MKKPRRIAAAAAVLVLACALSGNRPARGGQPPDPARIAFGLVGLTYGQSLYLNVSNVHPPDPLVPVSVELAIVDAEGLTLANSSVRLALGRSATLVFDRDSLRTRTETRLPARAIVTVQPPDPQQPPDPGVVASLELVDNATLRTQGVVPPWVLKGFNPQPEPPATSR